MEDYVAWMANSVSVDLKFIIVSGLLLQPNGRVQGTNLIRVERERERPGNFNLSFTCLVEETQNLASHILLNGLLVIHDPIGSCDHHVAPLHETQKQNLKQGIKM